MSKQVYLYRITNTVDGKVYIGTTVDPKARFAVYRCRCHNQYLRNAFAKYGLSSFTFDVIACLLPGTDRDAVESAAIAAHDACNPARGYNQILGGGGSEWSEDRKRRSRGRKRGKRSTPMSQEQRAKISATLKNREFSAEHRKLISDGIRAARARKHWGPRPGHAPCLGRKHSAESIEKMRLAAKAMWARRRAEAKIDTAV